ncbi:MAG: hypothetical protein IT373_35565 [Polyangiaceae bacterium]|nr:hypothetical protein [Polyangiaceae bacterium]
MRRHRGLLAIALLAALGGGIYLATSSWGGWARIWAIVGRGDNLPIAGLIPVLAFFTYVALRQAFRHDALIRDGRSSEILDDMTE